MSQPERLSGVFCPVVTPFNRDFSPNPDKFIKQCQWLLSQEVGLAVFGTNSEANSLSVDEKILLLDSLKQANIDTGRMMPGTGCCALSDTVRLTRHVVESGCAGVLMLPPFFYKDVSDDGLYASYSEVIQQVGNNNLRIYLYHIPPISQVGISIDLVERLIREYPETVVGIKDSSGDWDNTHAMLERRWDNFRIFPGSESFLLEAMRNGGAGCISATANINPAAIQKLFTSWQDSDADQIQQGLDVIRNITQKYPMIPALKTIIGSFANDSVWDQVRPPLVFLDEAQKKSLLDELAVQGFDMPGPNQAAA